MSDSSSRPMLPVEAVRRAAALVQEIKDQCDDYGRLMQQRGGEAQEQTQRNRWHLQRMESSPLRDVRPRGDRASGGDCTRPARGHNVDPEGDAGGGNAPNWELGAEAGEDNDLAALMRSAAPWKKRPRDTTVGTHLTTSVRRLEPPNRATSSSAGGTESAPDDVGAGETHDEAYHRLRCCMGVTEEREPTPQASGSAVSDLKMFVLALLASGGEQHVVAPTNHGPTG